jgi:glycosyltransferase involved in cell wall biosynthesis
MQRMFAASRTIWSAPVHREISDLLRSFQPDLAHVHNTFLVISPSIYSACRQAGVPVVQTLHNYRLFCPAANCFRDGRACDECLSCGVWHGVRHACYRNSRTATALAASMLTYHRLRRTWWKEIDRYIVLTGFARSKFIQMGIPAEKIHVKPNFLHPDPGGRTQYGDWAIYPGRLSREKGMDTVLEAWEHLPKRIPLRAIGEGPYREAMNSRVAQRGLPISVEGRLSRDGILTAIKGSRLLVFPSQLFENFPMTILEAFACEVPVIASAMPAVKEIIREGATGLLFRPGAACELAEKVAWAWDHPREMAELARNARAEFRAKYTAPCNYQILLNIYEQALGRAPVAAAAA